MTEFADITAVVITRGDTDLVDLIQTLPYGEVLVNQNGAVYRRDGRGLKRVANGPDYKVYNRFVTADLYATNDTIFFQDDDVRIPDHPGLLDAYNARQHEGQWVANTQPGLDEAQGYWDLALVGCGSLVPKGLWEDVWTRWIAAYGTDDERFSLDCDFIFGTLSHWIKTDLGLDVLDVASADNRLWRQPGQMEAKRASINKARALRTVVLSMLTKNEEKNIVRALDSARPLFDSVLIHDTGSTDDTALEVSRWCAANGVPFTIEETMFEGFGKARQRLLEQARTQADFMLLMDADEEFIFAPEDEHPRPPLFCDAYNFHYEGPLDYAHPRLIYANFPWHWTDVKSHSALDGPEGRTPIGCDMESPLIRHHGDVRASSSERYQRDVDNLSDDINNSRDVARSHFMRGKAYEGMFAMTGDEQYRERAIEDYRARVELSQGDEESYYSRFRLGCLLVESGKFASGMDELFSAWLDRPTRVESLQALAAYATAVADATPYPVGDMIIVHRDLYR